MWLNEKGLLISEDDLDCMILIAFHGNEYMMISSRLHNIIRL